MYTRDIERALAAGANGPWIRYDLQLHANGSIGGYVYVCEGTISVANGVVEYLNAEDMLDKIGYTRTEAGCRITVLLDGEDVEADTEAWVDSIPWRTSPVSLGPD